MKCIIRSDASIHIGTGHIMRCLTLADKLTEKGVKVSFVCAQLPGNLCDFIEQRGFGVFRIPKNMLTDDEKGTEWTKSILFSKNSAYDLIVVDHYGLDQHWETKMLPNVKKIMVIDDLANRYHNCNILLDQNYYIDMQSRYKKLIPSHCKTFIGPTFTLLRNEFKEARENLRKRDGKVRKILIFFGGSDYTNQTSKALKALKLLNLSDMSIDVVVGHSNPHKEKIKDACRLNDNINFYCQVNNMAYLMANSDLSIGAGGTTTWERCFLGLPTITMEVASNQIETTSAVAETGAIWNLGWYENVDEVKLATEIHKLLNNNKILKEMEYNAMQLVNDQSDDLINYIISGNTE